MSDEIVRCPEYEVDGVEEQWVLEPADHLRRIDAARVSDAGQRSWSVGISLAEFLRAEPLVSEMQQAMHRALRSVRGATDTMQEDREVWLVEGSPTGVDLIRAAERVVDEYADRYRAAMPGKS